MMRFVDQKTLKGGEDSCRVVAGLLTKSQVSHQQGMVDDEEIGTGSISARGVIKAAGVALALCPAALIPFAAELLPDFIFGHKAEVVPTAARRCSTPLYYRLQFVFFIREEFRFLFVSIQLAAAEIVPAAFYQHCLEAEPGIFLEKRDILTGQLFLKVNRVGRNNDPLFIPFCPDRCGEKIRQRLACPGPGLDHRHPVAIEGFSHGKSHPCLLRPVFIAGQLCRDNPFRRKKPIDLGERQVFKFFVGKCRDDLIATSCSVVDDIKTDPLISQGSGYLEISLRRGERS